MFILINHSDKFNLDRYTSVICIQVFFIADSAYALSSNVEMFSLFSLRCWSWKQNTKFEFVYSLATDIHNYNDVICMLKKCTLCCCWKGIKSTRPYDIMNTGYLRNNFIINFPDMILILKSANFGNFLSFQIFKLWESSCACVHTHKYKQTCTHAFMSLFYLLKYYTTFSLPHCSVMTSQPILVFKHQQLQFHKTYIVVSTSVI